MRRRRVPRSPLGCLVWALINVALVTGIFMLGALPGIVLSEDRLVVMGLIAAVVVSVFIPWRHRLYAYLADWLDSL